MKQTNVSNFISPGTYEKVLQASNILDRRGLRGLVAQLDYFINKEAKIYQRAALKNPDYDYRRRISEEFNENLLNKIEHLLTSENAELKESGKRYQAVVNEGKEGFNPYYNELEKRESKKQEVPKDIQSRIDDLYKKIEKETGSVAREFGNIEELDKKRDGYYKEIEFLKKEQDKEFLKAWPVDRVKKIRADWNEYVSKELKGRPDYKKMGEKQRAMGFKLDDLKKAIKMHGL